MLKGRRPLYEFVVVVVVVALAVVLGAGLYAGRMKINKSRVLVQELASLRSSLILYKLINRENPPSLQSLASGEYQAGDVKRPFVESVPVARGGEMIDPFGNPYRYDPGTGWIWSTSPGFEAW